MDWSQRLSQLSPAQYKLLQQKLEERQVDVLQLPITPLARTEGQRFPLSFGQERLWFVQQLDPNNSAYNIIRAVRLEGVLDQLSLEQGLNEIVRRHEILRTQFILDHEKPMQYILPELFVPLEIVDLIKLSGEGREQEIRRIIASENQRPFDLAGGPLLRTKLLVLNEEVHVFLLVIHHIISDGISMQIFIQELVRLYESFSSSYWSYNSHMRPLSPLPELPVQYIDYTCWQRQWFGDETSKYGHSKKQETYWLNQFGDDIPLLNLPTDYSRPIMQSFEGNQFISSLTTQETRELKQLVLKEKSTLYIVLLAIYNILLAKLGGMDDIVVGTPVSGRRHPTLQKLIGMFANMLALRNHPNYQKTFSQFLQEVKQQTINAFDNQEYRYEDIVDKLNLNRSTSRNPLFDVVFLLDSNDLERFEINLPGLSLKSYKIDAQTSKFDLTLIALEQEDRLEITFEFCTKLFKEDSIERFSRYFKNILAVVVSNPGVQIGDIDIVPDEEKTRILFEYNRTQAQFPTDKAIHQLLADQVERTPDRVALVFEAANLSYRQLDQKARDFALILRNSGLESEGIVMITMDPSLDLVIGIVGILKAGGAYLPVTPDYPQERINYMLKDSNAKILVTNKSEARSTKFETNPNDQKINVPNKNSEDLMVLNFEHLDFEFFSDFGFRISNFNSSNLAYIIYTSGSTGRPKGVMVEHRGVVNILWDLFRRYPLEADDAYLFKTAFTFDVSVSELFGWFWRGGRLVILNNDDRKDPEKIISAAAAHRITHINFVPPMFSLWLEYLNEAHLKKLSSLKYIFVAGEALLPQPVLKFKSLGSRIMLENIYGPTEATIYASWYSLAQWEGGERVPIGRALANVELHILDRNQNMQPIGVAGELCIAGMGLARGYLNNPELTAEKFKKNRSYRTNRTYIIYKTGDLVRWLPDGNIEYFGRIDQQVKVRGFRIELGEIENRLLKHPQIKEAVVLVREDETNDKYLIAYFVAAESGKEISTTELKQYIAQHLPEYMVPGYFLQIEKIPLNPSGKIDRKVLPQPEITAKGRVAAPTNEIEAILVEIWSKVLGIEKGLVSIDRNFFELGGHSLKAAAMISRIHKELDVKIPLLEIFKAANIRTLSKYIVGLRKELYQSIEPVEKKDYYILSPAQKRVFVLQQMELESTTYNMPRAFLFTGELDTAKLETVFRMLSERHESLRTSFHMIDNEPVQRIHAAVEIQIQKLGENGQETAVSSFVRPFDLSRLPLLRVGLIKKTEAEHILLVDMHHIISDGVSHDILAGDFFDLYNDCRLEPVRIQYKDFSEWQNSEKEKEKIHKQETYWLKIFEGEIPVLNLFTDFPRPAIQSFEGSSLNFELPTDIVKALQDIAVTWGATPYMILLAVYNVFLAKLTGQEDIVVGTPTAGRGHADLEKIIGMFVNTLALRNSPEGHKRFVDFLIEVKEQTLEAFENQEYQFENLVERVLVNRDAGRNPIFDVVFTLQNLEKQREEPPRLESSRLKIRPYEIETGISKFDLILTCVEVEGEEKVHCTFDYCTKLFKEETIRRFTIYFKNVASAIIKNGNQEISHIEIITAEEKEQILHEFNDITPSYPREISIIQIFEQQVSAQADRIAVVDRGHSVSYCQLNKNAHRLASLLIEKGVQPDTIVGLLVERSLEMIVCILGIWKVGCAYLPLNPKAPAARNDYMLKECSVSVLVSAGNLIEKKNELNCQLLIVNCELLMNGVEASGHHSSFIVHHSDDLAYIIFTSGSTGNPKGVLITHANLSPLLHWGYRHLGIGKNDRALQNLSYYFDWSVWEMFIVLTSGASLYMVSEDILLDAEACVNFMNQHCVTVLHVTPTQYQYIVKAPTVPITLKYLFIGAEKLTLDLVERSFASVSNSCRVFNMYGPTEATIISAVLEIQREGIEQFEFLSSIPIGIPTGNTVLLILDQYMNLCPVNIAGELYIGGDGLSMGYLNNPEMTTEKFINNRSDRTHRTYIIYKTGDLARWLNNGNIEYLGRIDQQVKIRGYRIELGEIEDRILQYPHIKDVVVLAKEDEKQDKYLIAYFVYASAKDDISVVELRQYLAQQLPEYMIPSYFIQIEKIPLNPNGKIDLKALPAPEVTISGEFAPPENEIQMKLVEIWSGILGIEKNLVGIGSNFFQLGGHSLRATVMVSGIHKVFNVKVPLTEIFINPTIRELSAVIESLREERYASIEPVEKKDYYILSPAQKRLYILQQIDQKSTAYNMPRAFQISGELDTNKLENVFERLIDRHESLRTSFHMIQNVPVQGIHDRVKFQIEYYDLATDDHGQTRTFFSMNFIRPFNLSQAPLLRVGLIKKGKNEYTMFVDMHHIISDGVSHGILAGDFYRLYNDGYLEPVRIQYRDFSEWQNSEKEKEKIKSQETYWLKIFEGEIPVLNLFTDFPRPPVQSFAGSITGFELSPEVMQVLRQIAVTGGVTLYMLLLAMYNVLLIKLTGREDIVVGTPTAGRRHADLEKIIGMFVNTLALRNYPEGHKRFVDFLIEVKERTLAAFENQEYQFEDLVEKVVVKRDVSRNPIFDTVFALQNIETGNSELPLLQAETSQLQIRPFEIETGISKFDLILTCSEIEDKLFCTFDYCARLFKEETIQRFITYFKQVVSAIITDRNQEISHIEIITAEEKEQILHEFNDITPSYPRDRAIIQIFEEQANSRPNRIAVVDRGHAVSYCELNEIAHRLASLLIEKGVPPHTIVGLLVERSLEMIIGILGIWKVGCAYLPLNPKAPAARNDYMLKECSVSVLVSAGNLVEKKNEINCQLLIINCELLMTGVETSGHNSSFIVHHSDHLAYIIFTSGSTGNPKGVLITHANLSPLLHWGYRHLGIVVNDRALQNLSYYFDWSAWEMFIVLTSGASLYMVSEDILLDAEACVNFMNRNCVTILHVTPTQYQYIVKAPIMPITLNYLFIGAEKLTLDLVERSLASVNNKCRVFNMYGPTEATIISAVLEIKREGLEQFEFLSSIPIGKPTGNSVLFILDQYMNLCPLNIAGELYISGDGLSMGYLNNPEMTTEKFINNRSYRTHRTYIIYKTGDLARWLNDGNIEYLGRIDQQVKIRGYRIELGEIESRILQYLQVKEVVVLAKEDESLDKYLIAYLVAAANEKEISTVELRQFLAQQLPEYMIPSYFVQIEKIPLNPNGKIDLKALPTPEVTIRGEFAAPENEIQMKLAEIWSGILGIEKNLVGIDSNFFELGGHSLRATVMVAKIHKEFNGKVPLTDIFMNPTIRELSVVIGSLIEEQYASIETAEKKDYYIVSPAQKRLYILQQMDQGTTAYNMPRAFLIDGELDSGKLESVFEKLIDRHESLRTSFHMMGNEPVQRIHDRVKFQIEYFDLATDDHGQTRAFFTKKFIQPFDLSQAPLMRVGLIKKADKEHMLLVDMHHIISDGVSHGILAWDFHRLYNNSELEPVRVQFKDFSEWQNNEKGKEKINKQATYWLKVFEGEIPVLNLLTDFPRPAVKSFIGDSLGFELSASHVTALKHISVANGVTLYMTILSIYYVLLAKLTNQEDIVIGTPTAGRWHADLEKIIGMFVNTLALRNYPEGQKRFVDFLMEVKEQTLAAFENQEYQFEDLVEKVVIKRDTGRNPIFDCWFALQNMESRTNEFSLFHEKTSHLRIKPYEIEYGISKFDLNLTCVEGEENLSCLFEYCTKLFKRETIQRFVNHFHQIAAAIVEKLDMELSRLEIITAEEKQQILYEFNDISPQYPKEKTVWQLFEEQAEGIGDRIAVVAKGNALTYCELNKNADRLAQYLIDNGVQANTIVGLLVERSLEMIVGILGIWKVGCAYLPLNPKAPATRSDYMLKECGVSALLTTHRLMEEGEKVERWEGCVYYIEELIHSSYPLTLLPSDLQNSSNLAYIIFTSGSTGNPKGVLITHANLTPLLHWGYRHLGIGKNDRALQNLSYYFDWSVWEMFIVLTSGASLYMVSEDILLDAEACVNFMNRHCVTVLHVTPTQYQYIVKATIVPVTLKYLFIGAEKLTFDLVERSFTSVCNTCRVFNMYGPTEATIISAVLEIQRENLAQFGYLSSIPIGRPTGNTVLLIFDKYMNLCPINIAGELYIAGDGLSMGYLNNPEMTTEKFINNRSDRTHRTYIIYKTGDLARWLNDGIIEFLGRIDQQVKIRGHRIELGEIEGLLLKRKEIKEAVVVDREGENGEKYLCAYIVPKPGIEGAVSGLKEFLSQSLPNYMMPAFFIEIEKIPLNPNGKINREALIAPFIVKSGAYTAPSNELEEILVEVWSENLRTDKEKIGIDDDFFELGGHSLKASIMASKIKERLNCTIPLVEIFKRPTVRELAEYIRTAPGMNGIESQENENLVLFKKGTDPANHFFMVHAGSGDVEEYIEFFDQLNRLNPAINGWGIRAERFKSESPQNFTIEELAAGYIEKIKKVQPCGPYRLAGWSIGGTIAFEMARQLEVEKQEISFLALIDTPGPQSNTASQAREFNFTLEAEWSWLQETLPDLVTIKKIEEVSGIEQLWDLIGDYLEKVGIDSGKLRQLIPDYIMRVVSNIEQLEPREALKLINRVRSLNHARNRYIPGGKIAAVIHFIGAGEMGKTFAQSWSSYGERPQVYNELQADHYTIFKMPLAAELAKLFNIIS